MKTMTGMISPHLPQLMGALYAPTRPYYNRMWRSWWVSTDADVRQVLTDDDVSAAHGRSSTSSTATPRWWRDCKDSTTGAMTTYDKPSHQR